MDGIDVSLPDTTVALRYDATTRLTIEAMMTASAWSPIVVTVMAHAVTYDGEVGNVTGTREASLYCEWIGMVTVGLALVLVSMRSMRSGVQTLPSATDAHASQSSGSRIPHSGRHAACDATSMVCLPATIQQNTSCLTTHVWLAGQLPLDCATGTMQYVPAVHACVPLLVAKAVAFRDALAEVSKCTGGVFTSSASLQRLRLCNNITGTVVIQDVDEPIDATVFWDIRAIQSMCTCPCPCESR